ncbi:hypothetical protein Tco_0575701 [Tanacetum coccineum]
MDSIISLGQKNTLAEYMILFGADNRPPMLDKDLYDSWKSRMELYMQNREHGRMILESVEHGPLIWPTVEDNGVIRKKKYADLSTAEKIQADCDMKATNIILQGLPVDIYSLVNHHRVAKDLWERVQLLILKFVVLVFSPGDDLIACLNKAMAFLTAVASSRFPSTNNQLRTSSNLRNQATIQDGRVTVQQVQGRQGQNYSGTTYKGNATSLRGNTTSGQARVVKCYNCQDPGIPADQAQTIIPHNATFQTEDLDTYDSCCDDLSTAQAILMANISNYGSDVISEIKPTLYDGVVMSKTHVAMHVIDDEETLILEEESRSKLFEKAKDPEVIAKKILINLSIMENFNQPTTDAFGKGFFLPQQEFDVPSELTKVSLVNASLKKLKFHFTQFDSVVKKRTTPSALEEGEWGFEHTKTVFNNETIPFLKSLKYIFNMFDKDLLNEITEVQTVFDQMEASVQQFLVDKKMLGNC